MKLSTIHECIFLHCMVWGWGGVITGVEVVTGFSSHPRSAVLPARAPEPDWRAVWTARGWCGRAGQERGQQRCRAPEADTASRPHKKLSAAEHIPSSILLTGCCCSGRGLVKPISFWALCHSFTPIWLAVDCSLISFDPRGYRQDGSNDQTGEQDLLAGRVFVSTHTMVGFRLVTGHSSPNTDLDCTA